MFKPYNGTKYFNGTEMLSHDGKYNIVISERNNGKSFWFLQKFVCDYFNEKKQMGYIRRSNTDLKNYKVDEYFEDTNFQKWLQKTFDYDGILCDRETLYFYKWDNGKRVKFERFGHAFSLQRQVEYKSLHFDEISNIIFEEFIVDDSPYLPNEYSKLNNLVSTIARGRKVCVALLGNTTARDCPYLLEYGINLQKVKQNETLIIDHNGSNGKVRVVFFYAPQKSDSEMFFGKAEKSIVAGQWEVDEMPHLFCNLNEVEKIYTFYMITKLQQAFKCVLFYHDGEPRGRFVYVYPYDYDDIPYTLGADIFTDTFSTRDNYFMHPRLKRQFDIYNLYIQDRFVYASDMCGTEFKRALRNYNPFR